VERIWKVREVTIVVLIILAGITLNAVIGENGIILQAKDTKNLITNETTYDNAQLAQLQNELKDNGLYSGIGIIPGTDIGGSSEGGENGIGGGNQGGNSGGNPNLNSNTGGRPVDPNKNNQTGGEVSGETAQDPSIKVLEGEEIAASFYRSDVTIQIFTQDKTQRIKYILTTTVPDINNELYPSGLVRELDIENGGTLTFTKDGEYTITAYAYDVYGQKSNPTVMWLKRETGTTPGNGVTVSVASGNMGKNDWYTSNITIRVLGTDTGSTRVTYRVVGNVYSTGVIGNYEYDPGYRDTGEIDIANGTTFKIALDGEFAIVAYTYDSGGMRLSTATTLNVKRDATRPIVTLYKGEQVLGQGFRITLNAEDHASNLADGVEGENKAGKRYNYRHKLAPDMTYTDTMTQNATQLYTNLAIDKTYDMYVVVTDNAGNKTASDVISKPALWVSKNEGNIGETGTHNARTYYQGNIDVSLTGQDRNNVDIKKVTYQITGTATENGTMDGTSYNKGQALPGNEIEVVHNETKTIPVRADGNWTVTVRNYNKENVVVSTNTLEVTRDTVNPAVNNLTIATTNTKGEPGYYSEPKVTVQMNGYTEDTSLKKAVYIVTGTATGSGKVGNTNVSAGSVNTGEVNIGPNDTFDITADGTWNIVAKVYDRSGRTSAQSNTLTFVRDTVAPTITSFKGTITWDVTTGSGTLTATNTDFGVSGQATGGGYTYYLGSTKKAQTTENSYAYTGLNGVPKVIAKDKAGNVSESIWTKDTVINFPYKGQAQSLTLASGKYKLEVWGAQGEGSGGRGGYSVGNMNLQEVTVVYSFVGGTNGFNGGGTGGYSGGGGTDFRIINNTYNDRVIVAGGGGGAPLYSGGSYNIQGCHGGGTTGGSASGSNGTNNLTTGFGGTQSAGGGRGTTTGNSTWFGSAGGFGVGGKGGVNSGAAAGGSGGGGWFGGGGGMYEGQGSNYASGGGGGSGYVLTASSYKPTGYALGADYFLSSAQTIAGNQSFPKPGGGTETGHSGNGYARITLVE